MSLLNWVYLTIYWWKVYSNTPEMKSVLLFKTERKIFMRSLVEFFTEIVIQTLYTLFESKNMIRISEMQASSGVKSFHWTPSNQNWENILWYNRNSKAQKFYLPRILLFVFDLYNWRPILKPYFLYCDMGFTVSFTAFPKITLTNHKLWSPESSGSWQ